MDRIIDSVLDDLAAGRLVMAGSTVSPSKLAPSVDNLSVCMFPCVHAWTLSETWNQAQPGGWPTALCPERIGESRSVQVIMANHNVLNKRHLQ